MGDDQDVSLLRLLVADDGAVPSVTDVLDQSVQTFRDILGAPMWCTRSAVVLISHGPLPLPSPENPT